MEFIAYIIYSDFADKFYIGQTNNLKFRLSQHNGEKAGYTKKYQPWRVIYYESFKIRSEAVRKEKYLKSLKNKNRIREYINQDYKMDN